MENKSVWINEIGYWPDDQISGARILQLTGFLSMATNIYCEDPACSKKNRIAVYRLPSPVATDPGELWVTDLEQLQSIFVDKEIVWFRSFPQSYGNFFFYQKFNGRLWEIKKLCFPALEVDTVCQLPENSIPYETLGSASPCGRYIANLISRDDIFDVVVFDLETKKQQTIVSGPDFCNPHPRFDRMKGEWVLVQHNRDCIKKNGHPVTDETKRGTTLVLCKRDGSTSIELPVARPYIPQSISGHEAWIYNEPAFLFSTTPLNMPYDDGNRCGNLLMYRIGDEKPSVVAHAPEIYFGHVSTSSCGKYWCCDAWDWSPGDIEVCTRNTPKIAVGSIKTGKFAFVCQSGGFWTNYEAGHCHPYLSADNRFVVFSSTRTGIPQVFCAILPDGFLENLES